MTTNTKTNKRVRSSEAEQAQVAPIINLELVAKSDTSDFAEKSDTSDFGNRMTVVEFLLSLRAATELEGSLTAWLATASLKELDEAAKGAQAEGDERRKKLADMVSKTRKRRGLAADSELSEGQQVKITAKGAVSGKVPSNSEKSDTSDKSDKSDKSDSLPVDSIGEPLTPMEAVLKILPQLSKSQLEYVQQQLDGYMKVATLREELGL